MEQTPAFAGTNDSHSSRGRGVVMHTLSSTGPADLRAGCRIDIADRTFADAVDVARFAEEGGVLVGQSRCESWHLDPVGRWVCGTRGTMCDSLDQWAADPHRLLRAYLEGRVAGSCTPRWVIVDERPQWETDPTTPTEADVEQFLRLRRQLAVAGITLVDAVIFDDRLHWWSICELVTGSTRWGEFDIPLERASVA